MMGWTKRKKRKMVLPLTSVDDHRFLMVLLLFVFLD